LSVKENNKRIHYDTSRSYSQASCGGEVRLTKGIEVGHIFMLGTKYSAPLTAEEAQRIVDGDLDWMLDSGRPLVQELYVKMKYQGMRPRTIVDYTREPFIFRPGNVRVTLDYNIRTGLNCTDLLDRDCVTVPAGDAPIILEVKWDDYLPDIIRDIVQTPGRRSAAFSKYAQCRIYG